MHHRRSKKLKRFFGMSEESEHESEKEPEEEFEIKDDPRIFQEALLDAGKALDESGIPFHLHSGTALGSIRNNSFIPHDVDIDLAIFIEDYRRKLVSSFKNNNFVSYKARGTLKFGKEYSFKHKNGVRVDVFCVYFDPSINKMWVASFMGKCTKKKYKLCRWAYRPYKPVDSIINGHTFKSMPISALEDAYGKRWNIPKKFSYWDGIEDDTLYTNLIDE